MSKKPSQTIQQKVSDAFFQQFNEPPALIIRAPGRVNLIGEHTDYNDGFVLPMAIDRAVWMAVRPRADRQVTLTSLDMGETESFSLDNLQNNQPTWIEYVKGVAWFLAESGAGLAGWEGVMAGDVPIGAGLSSSAALEMAAARAFTAVSNLTWDAPLMANIGRLTENEWMGVKTGIMDQMISAAGVADHALLIDCRSLETEAVPLPGDTAVIILDTSTRRGVVDSAYNERRQQCETAAAYFGVPALRDVDLVTFQARGGGLDEVTYRRARHIITENERVLNARQAMIAGDTAALGMLMNQSHISMRDDFEISSSALNSIVAIAQSQDNCPGARMTGAGFGGCAVALVQTGVEDFVRKVEAAYIEETGLTPNLYVCRASKGAEVVKINDLVK